MRDAVRSLKPSARVVAFKLGSSLNRQESFPRCTPDLDTSLHRTQAQLSVSLGDLLEKCCSSAAHPKVAQIKSARMSHGSWLRPGIEISRTRPSTRIQSGAQKFTAIKHGYSGASPGLLRFEETICFAHVSAPNLLLIRNSPSGNVTRTVDAAR